jgi:hypothetical protein
LYAKSVRAALLSAILLTVLLAVLTAACGSSGGGTPGDAAADGGSVAPDTGPADSGMFGVACGNDASCASTQYCHVIVTPPSQTCEMLPPGCSICPCLINTNPCPATVHADCMMHQGQGITIICQ